MKSERFILRQLSIADENEIFRLRSENEVLKYIDIQRAKTIDDARKFINKIISASNNVWHYWAISFKNNSKLIGTICLWNISENSTKAEIGFMLLPEFHGKGIMQEVIPEIISFGFECLKLKIIIGEASPDNIKSIKLLEKFGFVFSSKTEKWVVYSLGNPALK